MSFLTDTDLKTIISSDVNCNDNDKLIISPFSENCVTPIGYDLRVGGTYVTTGKKDIKNVSDGEFIVLPPNSTSLITTLENIEMPKNRLYSGLIESKVSKVSQGLSHISTTVDPDWRGELLIAVHNHSSEKVSLKYGDTFCTIVFVKNESASTKKSGHDPGRRQLLLNQFAEISKKSKLKKLFLSFAPPFVIIGICAFIGYQMSLAGMTWAFSGMIALGAAIAQFVSAYLK